MVSSRVSVDALGVVATAEKPLGDARVSLVVRRGQQEIEVVIRS
jgi:hypothetical protein